MYKFFIGFIILAAATAIIMYGYGKKTLTDMTSEKTDAFVESTLQSPNAAQDILMKNWMDYTPPSKKFNAKFPTSPQHATDRSVDSQTKELKQYEMYISENNGKVFMISVISFLNEERLKDEEALLKNIINDMVASNPGNKLDNIQYTNQDHKTANFLITNAAYAIVGRAFVEGNQLYVLSALSKTPDESKNEFNYFVNSFKLISSEPTNLVPFPPEK